MTPRQNQALEFIKKFWKDNGYAPSYEDIKVAIGTKSKSSVAALIDRLEERGEITRIPHLARSIRLINPVLDPVPEEDVGPVAVGEALSIPSRDFES